MGQFRVPEASSATEAEETYEALAAFAGRDPAPPDKRVESISFRSNSEDWIAEVGKDLRGSETGKRRRQGRTVDVTTPKRDGARVLAIFGPSPYLVVTDAQPIGSKPSAWVNPFMAGVPDAVIYFERAPASS